MDQHQKECYQLEAQWGLAVPQAAATVGARTVGRDDGATVVQNGPKAQLLLKRYRWLQTNHGRSSPHTNDVWRYTPPADTWKRKQRQTKNIRVRPNIKSRCTNRDVIPQEEMRRLDFYCEALVKALQLSIGETAPIIDDVPIIDIEHKMSTGAISQILKEKARIKLRLDPSGSPPA